MEQRLFSSGGEVPMLPPVDRAAKYSFAISVCGDARGSRRPLLFLADVYLPTGPP